MPPSRDRICHWCGLPVAEADWRVHEMRCVPSRTSSRGAGVPSVTCSAEGCTNSVEAHVYSMQMLCPTHMISTALPPDIQPERPLSDEEMVEDLLELRKALDG